MSVNKYDHNSGQLTTLASGSRTWIGTKEAYEQAKQAGTLPTDVLAMIVDDVNENTYSTEELDTGRKWIDGKPIYRKSGYITSGTMLDSTLTSSYIDVPINFYGSRLKQTNWNFISGYSGYTSDRNYAYVGNTGLVLTNANNSFEILYWTIEYTKKDN